MDERHRVANGRNKWEGMEANNCARIAALRMLEKSTWLCDVKTDLGEDDEVVKVLNSSARGSYIKAIREINRYYG